MEEIKKEINIQIKQNLERILNEAETCANMADRQYKERQYLNLLQGLERMDCDVTKFYDDYAKYFVRMNERRREK